MKAFLLVGCGLLLIVGIWQHTAQVHKDVNETASGTYQLEGQITSLNADSFNFLTNKGETITVYGSVQRAESGVLTATRTGTNWSLNQWQRGDGAVGSGELERTATINNRLYGKVTGQGWVVFNSKGIFARQ